MLYLLPHAVDRAAMRAPASEAIRYAGESITYEQLATRTDRLAGLLRAQWNNVEIFSTGKFKKRLTRANEGGALLAVIIGEEELGAGEVMVKDLHGGEQMRMTLDDLPDTVSQAQNAHWLRDEQAKRVGTETQ